MTSTNVSNSGFFPTSYVAAHLTIVGDGGWVMYLGKKFFSQISEVKIFFLTYNGVRFFFSIIYVMREIFSIAGYNFSQVYPCKLFPSKSVYMIFFFKSPITSSKVKLPSAKIHPNIDSVDRTRFVSHCQSLLKQ